MRRDSQEVRLPGAILEADYRSHLGEKSLWVIVSCLLIEDITSEHLLGSSPCAEGALWDTVGAKIWPFPSSGCWSVRGDRQVIDNFTNGRRKLWNSESHFGGFRKGFLEEGTFKTEA